MSNPEGGDAPAPVGRKPRATAEGGDESEQHEQREHEGEREPHPGEPAETATRDSGTGENAVEVSVISVEVRTPANSAAVPQRPNDKRRTLEGGGKAVSPSNTTLPASTVAGAATPAAPRDAGSPYRAVYHGEDNWGATGTGEGAASYQDSEQEGSTFSDTLNSLRGFASRARQSVVRVAHGDFTDFRRAGESIQRVGTGDFSELAGIERYVCSLFEECTALSEKLCPCVLPEIRRSPVRRAQAGPPPIMMLVDTPGGPYMRFIPDALVEESVRQGLVSAAEVERQRQEAVYTAVPP